ncbi:TetR/AcrR family transcriptional regulator [Pelotomaculum terephthalicicum JT]|uniref:TetR/AcrR family transcriptional regulator n=1 Tax=Pelotomaculum terephthalicicum TaxID=206393 RepID=UPI001F0390F7|nr:TetR/AcrR family transcriptional regulator [Pelotomaculum terephthalicicum]MCG9968695.1 TetR/AcrR family transcriptional regulator [Pelotomaculum terephthalicicum JT]
MPKDTFNNLSDDKKQKIFDAAVKEFSAKRFSEASINQIVKTAEIPRGSFYQYFENKEDIYRYMFERIGKEKREIALHSENIDTDADFFEICLESTKATFEWAQHHPEYLRISMYMEIDDSEFVTKLRASFAERFVKFIERDKERGLIKRETDSYLVAEMVYALIWKQGCLFISDKEKFIKRLSDGIKIIRQGIGK